MADRFGDLTIPAPVPATGDAIADRALTLFGNYFQAFLNAYAQTAWTSVAPSQVSATKPTPSVVPVVRRVFTHDPREYVFNEADLPALYMTRAKGERYNWMAEDYRVSDDRWTLWWVFQPSQQETQRRRDSFTRAIVQYIDRAIEKVRDAVHAVAGDPDSTAASVAALPSGIKMSVATSTTTQTYSGAALNGSIGATAFAPARHITITVGGTASSIADGSVVLLTGLGSDGHTRVARVTMTQAGAPGVFRSDWSLTRVDSIEVPGQAGTAATLSFGLEAFTGLGSVVMRLANVQRIELAKSSDVMLAIKMHDGEPRSYDAVEIEFSVEERFDEDISILGDDSVMQQFTTEDDLLVGEAS